MSTVTGLSLEQAKAKVKELKAQGKTESTSKEVGKLVNYIKTLEPSKYGADQVAAAQLALKSSTQPSSGNSSSGIDALSNLSGGSSNIDLNSIYQDALNKSGVSTLESDLKAKKEAKAKAAADVNDNPYYSEATRTGKIAKVNEAADTEITNLESELSQKKADAQVALNIATAQYNINSQNYQQNLSKLNLLISSGALLNASGNDIATIAKATGLSTTMVSSMRDKMKSDLIKPYVYTDTDDGGNVTIKIIDQNTGNVISSNSLGKIGKSSTKSNFDISSFWAGLGSGGNNGTDITSLWGN